MSKDREAERNGQQRPRTAADRRARRAEPPASDTGASALGSPGKGRPTPGRTAAPKKPSLFARLMRYLREVVGELRKVIWPSRKQLVTYTIVVLVFVSFMVAFIALLDWVFGQGVLFLFGN